MEPDLKVESQPTPEPLATQRMRFYYLDSQSANQLDGALENFVNTPKDINLLEELNSLLPIEKWNNISLRQHVEGMYYISEKLWDSAMENGKKSWGEDFSRESLLRIAKTMPMSHYCYLVGSREPANVLLTRSDVLQDPGTAMVKLRHDIGSLADFISNSQATTN